MSALPHCRVPTLTEVIDASEWQGSEWQGAEWQAPGDAVLAAEPEPFDEATLQAITQAVDAAVELAINDVRARLRPRIEAAVRQALKARLGPDRRGD